MCARWRTSWWGAWPYTLISVVSMSTRAFESMTRTAAAQAGLHGDWRRYIGVRARAVDPVRGFLGAEEANRNRGDAAERVERQSGRAVACSRPVPPGCRGKQAVSVIGRQTDSPSCSPFPLDTYTCTHRARALHHGPNTSSGQAECSWNTTLVHPVRIGTKKNDYMICQSSSS